MITASTIPATASICTNVIAEDGTAGLYRRGPSFTSFQTVYLRLFLFLGDDEDDDDRGDHGDAEKHGKNDPDDAESGQRQFHGHGGGRHKGLSGPFAFTSFPAVFSVFQYITCRRIAQEENTVTMKER